MKYNMALPYFATEDIETIGENIKDILRGKGRLSMGQNVVDFEKKFAKYIGTKYAVATTSCTSALEITLAATGITKGDEVIVPVQTFIATGSSVARVGGRPVFCEVDKNFLLDFNDLKQRITKKTRAVIIVYFAGLIPVNIFEIKQYLKGCGICLIEDVAHAHGASIDGIKAGNIGDFGCFSFYPTKIMTTGEGGMITLNDEKAFKKCSSLRSRGLDVDAGFEIYSNLGSNHRVTEIQAILGLYQLKRLNEFVNHRNEIAKIYKKILESLFDTGKIRYQEYTENIRHSFWRFMIMLDSSFDRKIIQKKMAEQGIQIDWPYSPLLHLQPIFKKRYNTKLGEFPIAEAMAEHHVCLPIHLGINEEDADHIANNLLRVLK